MPEEIAVVLTAKADQYHEEMRKAVLTAKGLDKEMRSLSANLGKFSTAAASLGKSIALPTAAVLGAAIKASIDFETAFAGVRKTVNATETEFAVLEQGIRQMALELPQSASAIAGIAEAAGQLGIENDAILSFTRVMADLGVATNMSSQDAATSLARLANITQMPQTEFERLGSTIVALGNSLATTESEIVEMGLRIAGAGETVGMTEAEILSLAGALSSVGIEAQAGGSSISRVMVGLASEVASGGKRLGQFARVAGMSSGQFAKAFEADAADALLGFIEGLGRMQKEGKDVFAVLDSLGLSEVRVRDALLRASNAGDLFRRSLELGNQAWAENNALSRESGERYKTTASQLGILKNNLTEIGLQVGEILLPEVLRWTGSLKEYLQAWQALPDEVKRSQVELVLTLAKIGGSLWVLGTLAGWLKNIVDLARLLKVPTLLSWLAAPGTLAALKAVGLALGSIAAAFGGIYGLFKLSGGDKKDFAVVTSGPQANLEGALLPAGDIAPQVGAGGGSQGYSPFVETTGLGQNTWADVLLQKQLKKIRGYALGGLVPGPQGSPQLAVVHGGERVVPSGAEMTVNHTGEITVRGVTDHGQLVAVMDLLASEMRADSDRYAGAMSERRLFR